MNYTRVGLPWSHGLGKDVKDCTTSKEVMKKANLNWFVDKCELVAKMPFGINRNNDYDEEDGDFVHDGNIYRGCPNAYATYRTDINEPLGIVKSKYEVVQNTDAFNFFDEAIGEGKAIWQSAGMFGLGHKIFVTAKIPFTGQVGNDEITNYLVFSNSHDGSSSINIMFTPIRVICTNMLNGALDSSYNYIRIKHTKTAKERLHQGSDVLRIACEYAKDAQDLYKALDTIKMKDSEVLKYIAQLFLTNEENIKLNDYDSIAGYNKLVNGNYLCLQATNISTRKSNQIAAAYKYYHEGIGQKEILGTAWGAYNAITGYYSNVYNMEGEKRMDSLLYGNANNVMQKAIIRAYNYAEAS